MTVPRIKILSTLWTRMYCNTLNIFIEFIIACVKMWFWHFNWLLAQWTQYPFYFIGLWWKCFFKDTFFEYKSGTMSFEYFQHFVWDGGIGLRPSNDWQQAINIINANRNLEFAMMPSGSCSKPTYTSPVIIIMIIIAYLYSANFICVSRHNAQKRFIVFNMD